METRIEVFLVETDFVSVNGLPDTYHFTPSDPWKVNWLSLFIEFGSWNFFRLWHIYLLDAVYSAEVGEEGKNLLKYNEESKC